MLLLFCLMRLLNAYYLHALSAQSRYVRCIATLALFFFKFNLPINLKVILQNILSSTNLPLLKKCCKLL